MSGCSNVCVDTDYGFDDLRAYSEKEVRARKPYVCAECGDAIPIGARYHRAKGLADGDYWYVVRSCVACGQIRNALVCGSWLEGSLWEDIEEIAFPKLARVGLSECMAELPALESRNKLQARFDEWNEARE